MNSFHLQKKTLRKKVLETLKMKETPIPLDLNIETFLEYSFIHHDPSGFGNDFQKKLMEDCNLCVKSISPKDDNGDFLIKLFSIEVKISRKSKNRYRFGNFRGEYQNFTYYLLVTKDFLSDTKIKCFLIPKDKIHSNDDLTLTAQNGTLEYNRSIPIVATATTFSEEKLKTVIAPLSILNGDTYEDLLDYIFSLHGINRHEKVRKVSNKKYAGLKPYEEIKRVPVPESEMFIIKKPQSVIDVLVNRPANLMDIPFVNVKGGEPFRVGKMKKYEITVGETTYRGKDNQDTVQKFVESVGIEYAKSCLCNAYLSKKQNDYRRIKVHGEYYLNPGISFLMMLKIMHKWNRRNDVKMRVTSIYKRLSF
jgi:hypothetical protein